MGISTKYLFVIISLSILIAVCNGQGYITSASSFKTFPSGGTKFTITGAAFPPVQPSLYIATTDGKSRNQMAFNYKDAFNNYIYTVPPTPVGGVGSKRSSSSSVVLNIINEPAKTYYTPSPPNGVAFDYIQPTIKSVLPTYIHTNVDNQQVTINGFNFQIDPNDPAPIVTIDTVGPCSVVMPFTPLQIICLAPKTSTQVVSTISIKFYNNDIVTYADNFQYVSPYLASVEPSTFYLSDTPTAQTFKFVGSKLFASSGPLIDIYIGGTKCSGVTIYNPGVEIRGSCTFPNGAPLYPAVAPGASTPLPVTMNIIGNAIVQTTAINVEFKKPILSTVSPATGLYLGGTILSITGKFYNAITSINVGGIDCGSVTFYGPDAATCITGPDTSGFTSAQYPVNVIIGGKPFTSTTQLFTYEKPALTSVTPTYITNRGITLVNIKGSRLSLIDGVRIGGTVFYDIKLLASKTDTDIYIDIDPSLYTISPLPVQLIVKTMTTTTPVSIAVKTPSITSFTPKQGIQTAETLVTFTTDSFPFPLPGVTVSKIVEIRIGGELCKDIAYTALNTFQCKAQPSVIAAAQPIEFYANGAKYTTTDNFLYVAPTITSLIPSSTVTQGGGTLTLGGTNLDLVTSLKIGDVLVSTFTSQNSAQIVLTIPKHVPGTFPITLLSGSHVYPTALNLLYEGPNIISMKPKTGSKNSPVTITIGGTGFGTVKTNIQVLLNNTDCTNVDFTPGIPNSITCTLPKMEPNEGYMPLKVSVTTGGVVATSANTEFQYLSMGLECLSPQDADGDFLPRDFWYIHKLNGGDYFKDYLYLDNTTDSFVRRHDMTLPTGALAATFSQYSEYYYLFFNDQAGYRDGTGKLTHTSDPVFTGHVKGFFLFDDDGAGGFKGIHVMHSNPGFPSYKSSSSYKYYNVSSSPWDLFWLGKPAKAQHFFCYKFNDIEDIAKYFIYTNAHMQRGRYVPDMTKWSDADKNKFPALYDLIGSFSNSVAWPPRVGPPAIYKQADFVNTCSNNLDRANLDGYCYWRKSFLLAGRRADYWMKTSTDKDTLNALAAAPTYTPNRYVGYNVKTNDWDGLDLWPVIGETYQHKIFTQIYYSGFKQYPSNEACYNTGLSYLPLEMALWDRKKKDYASFQLSGRGADHSKIAYPVFPYRGPDPIIDVSKDINMFCVGDSNRHNNQGARGGGAMCFQHPQLVDIFNRMVSKYTTLDTAAVPPEITNPRKSPQFGAPAYQPLFIHSHGWTRKIDVDAKVVDAITMEAYSTMPRSITTIESALAVMPQIINITSKRTVLTPAVIQAPGVVEENYKALSPGGLGIIPAEIDISQVVAGDTFRLGYIAYDVDVGYICDYTTDIVDGKVICKDYRSSNLLETPAPSTIAFPNKYNYVYGDELGVRHWNLASSTDFETIRFAYDFRNFIPVAPPPSPPAPIYKLLINPAAPQSALFEGLGFIVRKSPNLCKDQLTYFMLQSHIYNLHPDDVLFSTGIVEPNWVNAIILALSKVIYNSMSTTSLSTMDPCFNLFPYAMDLNTIDMDTISKSGSTPGMINFYASLAVGWDLMSNTYNNGKGGRVSKTDTIPYGTIYKAINELRNSDHIVNIKQFIVTTLGIDLTLPSTIGIQNSLILNGLDTRPPLVVPGLTLASFQTKSLPPLGELPLSFEDDPLSPFAQILAAPLTVTIHKRQMVYLPQNNSVEFSLSLTKWVTIRNVNQGIQVLLRNTKLKTRHHEIQYIDDLARDQKGLLIDLCQQVINGTDSKLEVCTPMSIVSITSFLESAIISPTLHTNYGDMDAYFIAHPSWYNGQSKLAYDGMAIITINSLFCDISMFKLSDFQAGNFANVCSNGGPIITSILPTNGPTIGGTVLTINGQRFNNTMKIRFGSWGDCPSMTFVSSTRLLCTTPAGIGANIPLTLYTFNVTLYNLQRTTYTFSYNPPTVSSVTANSTTVYSGGGQVITITGTNFSNASDVAGISVTIDQNTLCSPILAISTTSIQCISPIGLGAHQMVQVKMANQQTSYTIQSASFNYSPISIVTNGIIPPVADCDDWVVIRGESFGPNPTDIPILYFDERKVEIYNFTNNNMYFKLDCSRVGTLPIRVENNQGQSFITQFSYNAPFITSIDTSSLSTVGGILRIYGYGWGNSKNYLDYIKIGSMDIKSTCYPFNTYVECFVPNGFIVNDTLTASVGGQMAHSSFLPQISYPTIPVISSIVINSTSDTLYIYGTGFVPMDLLNTAPPTATNYVQINFKTNPPVLCYGFTTVNLIKCTGFVSGGRMDRIFVVVNGIISAPVLY